MPGEYIVRLVFDRNHLSMVATREKRVIGGCCFRLFEGQNFAEIAFLAISYSEQVKGFGTQLMNKLKNWVIAEHNIRYFLTYADNFALGFFRKQGFTTDFASVLHESFWKGYIKDYDGGTLMICKMDPDINYMEISDKINMELEALNGFINDISPHKIVRKLDTEAIADMDTIPTSMIPGLAEINYKSDDENYDDEENQDAKAACFNCIIEHMMKDSASWPFKDPVRIEVAPDYYQTITKPIDLSTMRERVQQGHYDTVDLFIEDIELMFKNARIYNRKDTVYYKMADKLESSIKPFLDQLKM